jgi:hypothetical protein
MEARTLEAHTGLAPRSIPFASEWAASDTRMGSAYYRSSADLGQKASLNAIQRLRLRAAHFTRRG